MTEGQREKDLAEAVSFGPASHAASLGYGSLGNSVLLNAAPLLLRVIHPSSRFPSAPPMLASNAILPYKIVHVHSEAGYVAVHEILNNFCVRERGRKRGIIWLTSGRQANMRHTCQLQNPGLIIPSSAVTKVEVTEQ